MNTRRLLFIFLSLFPVVLSAITLNPSAFTAGNLNNVSNGDTVYLEPGVYNITLDIISAWTSKAKDNVTFQSTGSGTVEMDGTGFSSMPEMVFNNWNNLLLKDIKFVNIELQFDGCTNSTMDNLVLTGQKFDFPFPGKGTFCLRVIDGINCIVKNTTVDWTYEGWNGKGIKVNGGTNHQFLNNKITGRLIGAMSIITAKKASNNKNPVTNHIVRGGYMIRTIPSSEYIAEQEDHGIYIHNISHVTIDSVSFFGWTKNASGHGVKIKGANYIEVKNCIFNTSGVIIRVADNWNDANDHIWIHDNKLNDGDINSWTSLDDKFCINNSCVIENNIIYNGSISATTEDAPTFNMFNNLANKDGGVYNNHTKTELIILDGINKSGNDFDLSDTTTVKATGIDLNPQLIVIDDGMPTSLNVIIYPFDASNKSVTWSSSDTLIAKVSATGIITPLTKGNTKITVTTVDGGFTDTCILTVSCQPTTIIPYIQVNNGTWLAESNISVNAGDLLTLSPLPNVGTWEWSGPNEFTALTREVKFNDIQGIHSGKYIATCTNECGDISSQTFSVLVEENQVGFSDLEEIEISAYPNPFSSSFNLMLGDEKFTQALFSDMTGKVLIKKELNQENEVQFNPSYSLAPSGIYIIQLISDREIKVIKVIRR